MMAAVMKNDEKYIAEQYARQLWSENARLSIDDVARSLDKGHYYKLHKSELSRVRTEIRKVLVASGQFSVAPTPPMIRRKEEPFNPPRLAVAEKEPETMTATEHTSERSFPPSTTKERQDFLNRWVLDNPNATINEARKTLLDRFGTALGTAYIAETLKVAREIAGIEPKPQEKPRAAPVAVVPPPAQPPAPPQSMTSIQDVINAMRSLGLRRIEIREDGTASFDMSIH